MQAKDVASVTVTDRPLRAKDVASVTVTDRPCGLRMWPA
jgi:hypothetical protein